MYEDVPADRREHLLTLLGIEGQVGAMYVGMGPDDTLALPDGWELDEDE